jgi:hypothetical protein
MFIAQHAPRVSYDAVSEHFGLTIQGLGNAMASLSDSAPRISRMVKSDYSSGEYVMDPEDATRLQSVASSE